MQHEAFSIQRVANQRVAFSDIGCHKWWHVVVPARPVASGLYEA